MFTQKVSRKSNANCCVYGCNAVYRKNPDLTFHRFPAEGSKVTEKNEFGLESVIDRRKLWIIKLKIGKPVTINMRVCSKHFEESDFLTPSNEGYLKRYLKQTAVPSRNLPQSSTAKINNVKTKKKRKDRLMKRCQNYEKPLQHVEENESQAYNAAESEVAKVLLQLQDSFLYRDASTQTENHEEIDVAVQVTSNDLIQTDKILKILTEISSFNLHQLEST